MNFEHDTTMLYEILRLKIPLRRCLRWFIDAASITRSSVFLQTDRYQAWLAGWIESVALVHEGKDVAVWFSVSVWGSLFSGRDGSSQ